MKNKDIILLPSHIKTFNFVRKFIEKNTYSPELSEIAAKIELTPRQVWRLLNDLITLGYLSKTPHKKRSIKVEREVIEQN